MSDIVKQNIIDSMRQEEKNYLLAKKDLRENYGFLQDYHDRVKQSIIDKMLVNDIKESNYHRLVEKHIFKEIPISELEKVVSKGIMKHIMITVDLEATKQKLKNKLGYDDVVINPIIEAIKRVESVKILDLEEKPNAKKSLVEI